MRIFCVLSVSLFLAANGPAGKGEIRFVSKEPTPNVATPSEPMVLPTSVPSAVRTSCDTVAALVPGLPGIRIQRSNGVVHDDRMGREHYGCRVTVIGSTVAFRNATSPDEVLRKKLGTRGWQEDLRYAADGPDGTAYALRSHSVLCLFRGRWDGGDDSDPTYVPDDRYVLIVACMAEPADTTHTNPQVRP
jgi:hypothetical protein